MSEQALLDKEDPLPPVEGDTLPPEEELVVLRLVVDGLTDAAAARRLGVSVITVRRRFRRLRERVGATTRLQAAVIAARRGWL